MAVSKTTYNIASVARIFLGLIYLFFGLNFFFHFLPAVPPDPASKAGLFLGGLFHSGYFFIFLKTLETIYGLLLLADWFVPLVIILVFPISLNIFLFHIALAPAPKWLIISTVIILLNIYLSWTYRYLYGPLLRRINSIAVKDNKRKTGNLSVIS